ncbi:MAG: hypothetical protein CMJ76_12900 [Planctomycetaceae bacterium]|nr:hypothetical protein [Planctomycetaceae bacterium]
MLKFSASLAICLFASVMISGCADSQSNQTQNGAQQPSPPTTEASLSTNPQLAEPPLYKAAEQNDIARVKQLLAEGVEIDQTAGSDGETALHRAITRRSTEAAKILIEAGADINKPRSDGQTPLEMARVRNRTEILKLLNE